MAEKKTTKKEIKKVEEKKEVSKSVLISPRMTEKGVLGQEKSGVYVFNVERDATKKQISASVKAVYKVTPVKVNTTQIADKKKFVRGKWGVKRGGKKAYIYLKKGDKIDVA
jgi:Ribosomal protein L23